MTSRVRIAEPNDDVRSLLETVVRKLGFEPAESGEPADAMLLEPSCPAARDELERLGESAPPVVCLSIYPREAGYTARGSVAYLQKPTSRTALRAALLLAFAA